MNLRQTLFLVLSFGLANCSHQAPERADAAIAPSDSVAGSTQKVLEGEVDKSSLARTVVEEPKAKTKKGSKSKRRTSKKADTVAVKQEAAPVQAPAVEPPKEQPVSAPEAQAAPQEPAKIEANAAGTGGFFANHWLLLATMGGLGYLFFLIFWKRRNNANQ